MSLTELETYIFKRFKKSYSNSVLKKYARFRYNQPGKINRYGYKHGIKKTSAGYDTMPMFALWMVKNVKTRKKRGGRNDSK
jgi:hypothetical protein